MKKSEILKLEYVSRSPAGFDCYFCEITDRCIKIKGEFAIVYSGRIDNKSKGKFPVLFLNSEKVNLT